MYDSLWPYGPYGVCSLPGSCIHALFQARILDPFSTPGNIPDPGYKRISNACLKSSLYGSGWFIITCFINT